MNDLAGAFPELSARTGYAVNPIERLSERREDAGFDRQLLDLSRCRHRELVRREARAGGERS